MSFYFRLSILLISFFLSGIFLAHSQEQKQQTSGGNHTLKVCFGEVTGGSISILEHLNDSLAFTDPWANEKFKIVSFNLALKCNGNVIKYLENKSGNTLTPEMKEAVVKLRPNCSLSFDGIKSRFRSKDIKGTNELKHGILSLKVK